MRKRVVSKLKERYKISITPIPKVMIKVTFRHDGSWSCYFGRKSFDFLVSNGEYWDESGRYKYKGKHTFWYGDGEYIKDMWRHIQKSAYRDNIHPLDLA